jgi:hypothetical protein
MLDSSVQTEILSGLGRIEPHIQFSFFFFFLYGLSARLQAMASPLPQFRDNQVFTK